MYTCPKCKGTGIVPFTHIQNGKCFDCNGSGKIKEHHSIQRLNALKAQFAAIEAEYKQIETQNASYDNQLLEAITTGNKDQLKHLNQILNEFTPQYEAIKTKYNEFKKAIEKEIQYNDL